LGKLTCSVGTNRNGQEIKRGFRVVDPLLAEGRTFDRIDTVYGVSLPEFHGSLIRPFLSDNVLVFDEAPWIDKWARKDTFKQYQRMFAFCCAYSVMLEWFAEDELEFGRNVMIPAFNSVYRQIGVRPLIAQAPIDCENSRNTWHQYPQEAFRAFEQLDSTRSNRRLET